MQTKKETVSEAAERMWPNIAFDGALPQEWVNAAREEDRFDVRGNFVWGYPDGSVIGFPLPITHEGASYLYEQKTAGTRNE